MGVPCINMFDTSNTMYHTGCLPDSLVETLQQGDDGQRPGSKVFDSVCLQLNFKGSDTRCVAFAEPLSEKNRRRPSPKMCIKRFPLETSVTGRIQTQFINLMSAMRSEMPGRQRETARLPTRPGNYRKTKSGKGERSLANREHSYQEQPACDVLEQNCRELQRTELKRTEGKKLENRNQARNRRRYESCSFLEKLNIIGT